MMSNSEPLEGTVLPPANTEPVALGNAIPALVAAVMAVAVAFGVELTREQTVAVLGLVAAIITVVTIVVRRYVTPWARTVATRKANGAIVAGPAAVVDTGSPVTEPLPRRAREDSGH